MRVNRAFFLIIILFSPFLVSAGAVSVTIQAGDTLYRISRTYKVPVSDLIAYNNIKNPSAIKIGSVLKIPALYTVKKGDTLYGISKKFSINVTELCNLNTIGLTHVLKIGEELQVPFFKKETVTQSVKVPVAKNDSKITQKVPSSSADDMLLWPHKGKRIAITGKLNGEEILGKKGDTIVSVSTGKVVWVAPYRGYGKLIMIETRDKHIYAYGGNDETLVKVGDVVKPGTKIGTMGIDPIEKNAKAYFFVYKGGKPVDPRKAPRG